MFIFQKHLFKMPVRDRLVEMQKASKYCKDIEKGEEETEMKPLNNKPSAFEDFLEIAETLGNNN